MRCNAGKIVYRRAYDSALRFSGSGSFSVPAAFFSGALCFCASFGFPSVCSASVRAVVSRDCKSSKNVFFVHGSFVKGAPSACDTAHANAAGIRLCTILSIWQGGLFDWINDTEIDVQPTSSSCMRCSSSCRTESRTAVSAAF